MSNLLCIVLISILLAPTQSLALTTADFLRIPIGVKALAMGESFTAVADDASVMYWNPAGMSNLKSMQAFAMYNSFLLKSIHGVGSVIMPMKNDIVVGGMFTYFSQERFDNTDDNGAVVGTVTPNDMAVALGGSKQLGKQIVVGISGKFITSTLYQKTATAVAADLGALYKLTPDIVFGVGIRNLGTPMTFVSEPQNLPMTISAGAMFTRKMSPQNTLTITTDFSTCDSKMKIGFGGEYSLNTIFVRAGYLLNDTQKSYTLGAGIAIQQLRIDFAYIPFKLLGDTFSVSLSYALGR